MATNRPTPTVRVAVSPSLFESVTIHPTSPHFSLGMEEWTESSLKSLEDKFQNIEADLSLDQRALSSKPELGAPLNSLRLHTSEHPPKRVLIQPHPQDLELPTTKKRFQTLNSNKLDKLSKPCILKNTETSTKWALENFHSWLSHRNNGAICDDDRCPESVLEDMDSTHLNKWLAAYTAETRKSTVIHSQPSTLQSLFSGILRHMQSIDPTHAPNIFNKGNPAFRDLHCTMDSLYRQLCAEGVGAEKHSAEPFTKGDENKLWELGIMDAHSHTSLLRAIFFYNGKNFCLRGGEEYRTLKLSQLKMTQKGYIYTENASKNQ